MKKLIIDQAHSDIEFKVKHLMISTVKGHFSTFSGGVDEDGNISVSMNVNSIKTTGGWSIPTFGELMTKRKLITSRKRTGN